MPHMPQVLLIDGTSYIFRAFYALPPLNNSRGEPTGAIYGFCAMLHKLLQDYPGVPMVLFFDAGGQNWRHERYSSYKAHRQAPPEELIAQIKTIREGVSFFGIPIIQQHGVEADDFIAVVARQYAKTGLVLISSPDKDFMQLIGDNIMLEQSIDSKRYDRATAEEKYGVRLEQIIDYFALLGDSSDGIPGVPKVGPKTAQKLLKEYDTLEAILQNASDIPGAIGRSIESHKEQALLSRDLFQLATSQQVPWPEVLNPEALPAPPVLHVPELLSFYEHYELRSLLSRVKNQPTYAPVAVATPKAVTLLPQEPSMALWVGEDFLSWATSQEQAYYLEGDSRTKFLQELPTYEGVVIITDYAQVRPWLAGPLTRFDDLSLMSYVLEADQPTLWESLQQRLFPGRAEPQNKAEKAAWLYQAYHLLESKLTSELKQLLAEIDYPLAEILYQMQQAGICLDTQRLLMLAQQWEAELAGLKEQIIAASGCEFNINSSKQLREVLFEHLKIKSTKKTPKGELSTKEDVLLALRDQHPVIELLLSYRHLEKLRSTYTTSLVQQISPQTHRLHTTFDQKGTITGRLASSQPNLQNIPVKTMNGRQIRSAFCAPEGKVLVFFDYSQIELRLMAHMSQDPTLLAAYRQGDDIHRQTAMLILGLSESDVGPEHRQLAKTVNFGLIYGMSAYGLSEQLQISPKKAAEFIDTYFEQFPKIKEYMQAMRDFAKEHGYVRTLLGRKIPIRLGTGRGAGEHAWRAAINGPLQGTASDLIKKAMIDLQPVLQHFEGTRMLLQVHDELIFECPQDKALSLVAAVTPVMEGALELDIPLIVGSKIASRWE